jgi:CRISPR/Cas system Type II protein with McrA/HNH and RuvC-like nuclease domain
MHLARPDLDRGITRRPHLDGVTNPCTAALYSAQRGRCVCCDRRMRNHPSQSAADGGYTVEHILPRCLGFGLFANKALTCFACNQAKRDTLPSNELLTRARRIYASILPSRAIRHLRKCHPVWQHMRAA